MEALTVPANERGVLWDGAGLDAATGAAGGLAEARREVDDGLYRSRWERATPVQRDLLRALAALGGDGPAAVAEIARFPRKAADLRHLGGPR